MEDIFCEDCGKNIGDFHPEEAMVMGPGGKNGLGTWCVSCSEKRNPRKEHLDITLK